MRLWARGPARRLTRMTAAPLSLAYGGILCARSVWWERYARTPPLPTVSVGNLTIGGNGKTPFTLFLAVRLRQHGFRVGIVSRGYGGRASRRARLVSDGQHIAMTPHEAGDEPVMLINQSLGFGNGCLLPAGPLREPERAIRRADILVLVEPYDAGNRSLDFLRRDNLRGKPVVRARLQPSALTYAEKGHWHEAPLVLDRRRVVAVSGVANSTGFHAMIGALGAKLLRTLDYPDHHDYSAGDWENILAAARPAEMLITTEKDLVKLERFATPELPLYALHLNVTMEAQDETHLLTLIRERISRATPAIEPRAGCTRRTEAQPRDARI